MPTGKGPRPPFLHVVGSSDGKRDPGGPDSGVEPGEKQVGSEGLPSIQAVDSDAVEARLGLMGLAQSRAYTGYYLILHRHDPATDDETWEAVTQGMTLKDLSFASVNMQARIQDLMSASQEIPDPDTDE